MRNVGVLLYYLPVDGGKPLILGKATNHEIFTEAAGAALCEIEGQVRDQRDPVLAAAQVEELNRLRNLLSLLVPVAVNPRAVSIM
jgi:hypothetical protein